MYNRNDLKLTGREKLIFLLMFILYCIVSSYDFNNMMLFIN